jgi:hypothetical protein
LKAKTVANYAEMDARKAVAFLQRCTGSFLALLSPKEQAVCGSNRAEN